MFSTSYFWSEDILRERNVSDIVLTDTRNIPAPPIWLSANWSREIATRLELAAGDVEPISMSRLRAHWSEYRTCLQSVSDWMRAICVLNAFRCADIALMACRGARYHHDGTQYGSKAFCNLFLSEDKGLDLYFPHTGHCIPLARGTVVLFDTAQPHGVVKRGTSRFDMADFSQEQDVTQVFLSWELPIEDADLCRVLGIRIDDLSSTVQHLEEEQVWHGGVRANVCPESGQWIGITA